MSGEGGVMKVICDAASVCDKECPHKEAHAPIVMFTYFEVEKRFCNQKKAVCHKGYNAICVPEVKI